jgi:hypothetical protein
MPIKNFPAEPGDSRPAPHVEISRRTPPLGPERSGHASPKHYISQRGSQDRTPDRDRQGAGKPPPHHGGGNEAA